MRGAIASGALLALLWAGCGPPALSCKQSTPSLAPTDLVVTNATSFKGTWAAPVPISRKVAFQSLQGVLNKSAPRLFLNANQGYTHEQDWLNQLVQTRGLNPVEQDNLACDLKFFAPDVAGYVLYDSKHPGSLNTGLSVAGALGAIAADCQDSDLVGYLQKQGLRQLEDVTRQDSTWLLQSSYWGQLRRDETLDLSPTEDVASSRDFAVARGMPVFYDDPKTDPSLSITDAMFAAQSPGGRAYGWGYVNNSSYYEESFVARANDAGIGWVGSDQSPNLSVYASVPPQGALRRLPEPALPTATNVHYVTYLISDGDNIAVIQSNFSAPAADLYGGVDQGKVPIGWTLPPSLAGLAPFFMEWIDARATVNDDFVAGPSSWAYLYPSRFLDKALLAQRADAAFKAAQVSSFMDLDFGTDGFNTASLDPITASTAVKGGFYSALRGGDAPVSSVVWSNLKPVIQVDHLGFAGTAASELSAMAQKLNGESQDATTAAGYTAVYAQLWTTTAGDLVNLTSQLGPNVKVVRPDVFLDLLTRNVPH